ncbi:CopG family transcriptional regulator [Candidatus Bathyarchaeota archaeon]|nr:MAG: CopG family transcriptional regulator [Candidatus Bathyarchaeota archaeon]
MVKEKEEEKGFISVSIPTELFEKIKERIEGTGFASVSDYITYVLRATLIEDEDEKEVLTKGDEEKIKERLRALGYLS